MSSALTTNEQRTIGWAAELLRLEASLYRCLRRYCGDAVTPGVTEEMAIIAARWIESNSNDLGKRFRFVLNERHGTFTIDVLVLDIPSYTSRAILKARTMLLEERGNRG